MKIINRFFAWWKETFQKQGVVGKAVLGCSSLFVICCLCSVPLGILNQKSPASSIKPTSTFSVSTSTSPVAQIEQPTETPLSTPAIDSHPTELIVDVSKLIGVTISEVEAILGKPISTESISPDVIDDIPNGGEIQTYQVGAYEIDVDFDSQLDSTGVQIMKGLEEENWALTDWQTLLPRVGLDVTIAPDDSNDKRFVWHNVDGYGILISNGTSWQVWTVRVFLCQYSSLFPCSP